MKRTLFLTPLLAGLLALSATQVSAQEQKLAVRAYGVVGHSYADNFYGALAATAHYQASPNLCLTGGMEALRNQGYSLTAAWQANLPWFDQHFFLYNRYLYRLFARWNTNEFSSHVGVGYEDKHWRATLGLANRFLSPSTPYDQTGSTDYVFEPFNLMYEVQFRFHLDRSEQWLMTLRASDFDDFVTDRAYQPLFSLGVARSLSPSLQIYTDLVCQPTGMFSLSANYYQLFLKLGGRMLW